MAVSLITGPINSGKSEKLLDLLARSDPGRTGAIVVPDRAAAASLRRRFISRKKGKCTAIRGDSIRDWAGFVRALASPALPVISRAHSALLMHGVLERLTLSYFGRTARSYAAAKDFSRAILALKENLVRPDEISSIISDVGDSSLRERDLVKAYESYEKELSKLGLLDEGDLAILAIKNAIDGTAPLSEMKFLAFDEFTMPTPLHIALLRALARGVKDAELFVTCPCAESDADKPFASFLSRARDAWLAAIDDEEKLPETRAAAPRVSVFKAASPAQEARHVALMVAREEMDVRDIVVASRPRDSFIEWFLSEAHSMELLPEHPTLDGARGSPLAHELLSPQFIEQLPAKASIELFVEEAMKRARVNERVRPWVAGLRERRGRGRVAARSLTAAEVIEEILNELRAAAGFLDAVKLTREEYAQLLTDEMHSRAASAPMIESVLPFTHHALGSPLACRASRLIVPRMIEGNFPARGMERLFFGDWKDESIRRIFPDASDSHAKESYAFETMVRKCSGEITFVIPAVTDTGSETIPSPFVDRFVAPGEEPVPLQPYVIDRTSDAAPRLDTKKIEAVELARIAGDDPLESEFGNYMGVLASAESIRLVRERFISAEMSPTSLERYANCPFSFFAQDVLCTAEPLEDTPQIRGFDRGRIVHEILARFWRERAQDALSALPGARIDDGLSRMLREIAENIWEEKAAELDYVKPGLKEREIEEIVKMALCVISAEADEAGHIKSPLTPSEFEWEFSKAKGNALAIEVKGDEPLFIRGRVDRIDMDRDRSRFLVIDYKTGKEQQVVNRIESGEHLQLPLYISAAKSALLPQALPLGGLMVEIREAASAGAGKKTAGKTKGLVLSEFDGVCYRVGRSHAKVDEERMDELLEAAKRRAAGFASLIRRGVFPASGGADCTFCDYGDICRHKKVSAD